MCTSWSCCVYTFLRTLIIRQFFWMLHCVGYLLPVTVFTGLFFYKNTGIKEARSIHVYLVYLVAWMWNRAFNDHATWLASQLLVFIYIPCYATYYHFHPGWFVRIIICKYCCTPTFFGFVYLRRVVIYWPRFPTRWKLWCLMEHTDWDFIQENYYHQTDMVVVRIIETCFWEEVK